jgi:hypothetical protein
MTAVVASSHYSSLILPTVGVDKNVTICSKFQENKYTIIFTLVFHSSFALSQSIHKQREDSKKHFVQKPENICQNKARDVKMGQGMLGFSQRKINTRAQFTYLNPY